MLKGRRRTHRYTTSGHGRENLILADCNIQLAMFDNYHLIRENASFDLDNKILPNHLGERINSRYFIGNYSVEGYEDSCRWSERKREG